MTDSNVKKVRNVLFIILIANIIVAVTKIAFGIIIESSSMTADGFHSLSDGSSNVVGLAGIWYASKPVDEDHPYGHKKFETLAGLCIGGMLAVIGGKVIIEAAHRFFNPVYPQITLISLVFLIITLSINVFVCKYEYNQGRKLGNQILICDSIHTKSDVYVSIGVILTLVGIRAGIPPVIDTVSSVVVAIFIFHAAYEVFKESSGVLLDRVAVDSEKIKDIVMKFPEVKDVHKIRSRGGVDEVYIDFHIKTEPCMSVKECHALVRSIENKMQQELNERTQVIIHLEPFYDTL